MKKRFYLFIIIVSAFVPALVGWLFFSSKKLWLNMSWVHVLPHINAYINGTTAFLLVLGWFFIKNKKTSYHKYTMIAAFFLGIVFLISYVIYHATVPPVVYGDTTGNGILSAEELLHVKYWRKVYLAILFSHIVLAIITVPFVLMTFMYALLHKVASHRKIARYTLPIWLYVSISGVVVYFMIKPYYLF